MTVEKDVFHAGLRIVRISKDKVLKVPSFVEINFVLTATVRLFDYNLVMAHMGDLAGHIQFATTRFKLVALVVKSVKL